MGRMVHARLRGGEWRFREWSTIVDKYVTDEGSEAEMAAYLRDDYSPREVRYGVPEREIPERLERAKRQGTSALTGERADVNGPWETERCDGCGGFHHAFERDGNGRCVVCGEPESERSHGAACENSD